jgi:FkbM family methyltransferase
MIVSELVQRFTRARLLPRIVRAAAALIGKRAAGALTTTAVAAVSGLGRMRVDPGDLLGSRVFFFGVWEPSITHYMRGQLKANSIAVDIGANVGYYSLIMSSAVGDGGTVYAVEPSPPLRVRLQENLALNEVHNVVVVPFGISDRTERRAFYPETHTRNTGESHFGEPSQDGLELRRLQDVISEEDLGRVSLIKVDVEGMEAIVLKDLLTLVPQLNPNLTIVAEVRMCERLRVLLTRYRDAGFVPWLLENEYPIYRYTCSRVLPARRMSEFPADGQIDVALTRAGPSASRVPP